MYFSARFWSEKAIGMFLLKSVFVATFIIKSNLDRHDDISFNKENGTLQSVGSISTKFKLFSSSFFKSLHIDMGLL